MIEPIGNTMARRCGAWVYAMAAVFIAACSSDAGPSRAAIGDVRLSGADPATPTPHLTPPSPLATLAGVFDGSFDATTGAFSIVPHVPTDSDPPEVVQAWGQSAAKAIQIATVGATYNGGGAGTTVAASGNNPSCTVSTAANCGPSYNQTCNEAICANVSLASLYGSGISTVDVQVTALTTGAKVEQDSVSTSALTTSEAATSGLTDTMGLWRWNGATALTPGATSGAYGAAVTGATTWQFDLPTAGTTFQFSVLAWSFPEIKQIAAGLDFTCALTAGGAVYCWGDGTSNQLGRGKATSSSIPVALSTKGAVYDGTNAAFIAAGYETACLVTTGGEVACWGSDPNDYGTLGLGTTGKGASIPTAVVTGTPYTGSNAASVTVGYGQACVVTTSGALACWGDNYSYEGGNPNAGAYASPQSTDVSAPYTGSNATTVAAGADQGCSLLSTNNIVCWGGDDYGELGVAADYGSDIPVPVAVTTNAALPAGSAASVAAGDDFTCAVTTGGALACWGYNNYGNLGNSTTTLEKTPTAVSAQGGYTGSNASTVSVGDSDFGDTGFTACSVLTTGGIVCWGNDNYGQLGNGSTGGTSSIPVAVSAFSSVLGATAASVSVGGNHVCALSTVGTVGCWGDNASGQLGNNSTTSSSNVVAVYGFGG